MSVPAYAVDGSATASAPAASAYGARSTRHARVDELVHHDPRRDDAPREQELHRRRYEHDRRQPEPDRHDGKTAGPFRPCPCAWHRDMTVAAEAGFREALRQPGRAWVESDFGGRGRDGVDDLALDRGLPGGLLERLGVEVGDPVEVVLRER